MKTNQFKNSKKKRRLKPRYFVLLLISLFVIGFFMGKTYSASETVSVAEPGKKEKLPKPTKQIETVEERPVINEPVEKKTEEERQPVVEQEPEKVVYLTFDDGPSSLTSRILDVLADHDVSATFFMQGSNLKKEHLQESVKRAVKEGNYVGGHSMTHDYKTLYQQNQFVPEMKETLSLIHHITGTTPHLVRPPYGSAPGLHNTQIRKQLAAGGIKIWDWTIDSRDWQLKGNPNQIIENIKKETLVQSRFKVTGVALQRIQLSRFLDFLY